MAKQTRSYSALWQLTLTRWREFIREPEALFWTFVFPLLLAGGLGIAFRSRPPEAAHVGVIADTTAQALQGAARLTVTQYPTDSAAFIALRNGEIALVVLQNPDGSAVYRFDPSRPEAQTARATVNDALQRSAGREDPIPVKDVTIDEKGSRYIDFLIPGLLGMSLMGTGIWSVVFTIANARTKKLLKRLVATPMSRVDFLLSFIVSRFIFLVAEVAVLVGFGVFVFDVPIRGSPVSLAFVCLLSAFAFNALGILLASRAKTIEAVSGLTNFVMMPMWIFSGVFFSASNFPDVIQPFIRALPLTATVDALRGIMLQGLPLHTLWVEMGVLAAWLVVSFVVALRIFRWR